MRYILLAATGMRIGEMMALNVEHIADQHTTIRVRHSVWRKHIGAPKLNSVREVDLASPVAALLGWFLEG
jgi:integrase